MKPKLRSELAELDPATLRKVIRTGSYEGSTTGLVAGFVQANVVIIPVQHAFHFLLYCQRNPKPCPILDVLEEGNCESRRLAPGSDIRTDCPGYRVFRNGSVEERKDIKDLWQDHLVTFLIGCSFTFEFAMMRAGIPVRHIEENRNVPMFVTNRETERAGPFHGKLTVSMRPIPPELVSRAVSVTARYPGVHGAPVHIGDPESLGIKDLAKPDFGDPVTIQRGEIPVFWACGVTPQVALMEARLEFAVTHLPGHMFVTDRRDDEYELP